MYASGAFVTCLKVCFCGCALGEAKGKLHDAMVHGQSGTEKVKVQTKRCYGKACLTTYGPNYYLWNGSLINTVDKDEFAKLKDDDVLFVNQKRGFTLGYLRFNAHLLFRAMAPARAVAETYATVFHGAVEGTAMQPEYVVDHHKLHMDGLFYFYYLRNLDLLPIGCVIGKEIDMEAAKVFAGKIEERINASITHQVREVVVDGNAKIISNVDDDEFEELSTKKAGRPAKKAKTKPRTKGYIFAVDPKSKKVLAFSRMLKPEHNAAVEEVLKRVVQKHSGINCIVYDRCCSVLICCKSNFWENLC